MILIPASSVEDWRKRLADPEKHWREGYSAFSLAQQWQGAGGFPPEILSLFSTEPTFAGIELLFGIPEHKVPLPGGARASQTDLWVLARTPTTLVSIAVEGKVRESFGPTIGEWMEEATSGKTTRWGALCSLLRLTPDCSRTLRYQLFHRTASAILEANRFHAKSAALLVHSFSKEREGFADFRAFAALLGVSIDSPGQLMSAGSRSGVELFLGWAEGS